jgi:hypothetical protein
MLFMPTFMTNLVLTKSSGPPLRRTIFTGFCVSHRSQWVGGAWGAAGVTGLHNRVSVRLRQKMWPFIRGLSASQSSEYFLPEL